MGRCGLVLAGGGARGAYEVGVLYYLFVAGPRELRERARFSVLCGTSVGALNASAFAACAHQPAIGVRRLAELWRSLSLEQIVPLSVSDLVSVPAWIAGRTKRESLFPGVPVKRVVDSAIDWDRIHINLANGTIDAVSISATHVPSGKTVVFYETREGRALPWSRDPHVRAVQARLGPSHARASAAIPFVFPAVSIDGIPYLDGALRQNTPLSPALRLGSRSIITIGMAHAGKGLAISPKHADWERRIGRPVFLLGKVLNAMMLDHVDYDLIRLDHFNRILHEGEAAFGAQFVHRLNEVVHSHRQAGYRYIPHVTLRPSRDIGEMAAGYVRDGNLRRQRGLTSRALRMLAAAEPRNEADITSYVLFDGGFADRLINLGIEDARAQRDELLKFFDRVQPTTGDLP